MKIICNVTGSERKRLAEVLGAYLLTEPVYKKAPTFAYVVSDYTIDKNGTIFCPVSATVEDVAGIVTKLTDEGFSPEIEDVAPVDEDTPSEETPVNEAPVESPAETPDVAPEVEAEAQLEDEATEADVGAETPDAAALEEDGADEDEASGAYEDKLTVSIPRAKLPDDALSRLRTIISNKEELFKRALLTDALPIEVVDECIFFPWFTMTGIDGEANAYLQFITALCQMAVEQKRVLDKPYDGDNDRFAMRIFMVRLNMKGPEFALARKLMMMHLTGNSGWRYEDSVSKPDRGNTHRSAVQHLKKAYPTDTRVTLIPMSEVSVDDIHMTEHQLRAQFVETAKGYLGYKESDGSHKKIIDLYNSQKPLPVSYKVTYTDAWCATFVSAVAVKLGLTDIIFPECSCNRMIALYQKAGRWTENDAYVPNAGDIIMYDWQDSGVGDNVGTADHVGIVCSVDGDQITVIEGNKSNAVGYRTIKINGRYIRGYCLPDFASKATGAAPVKDWAGEAKAWAVEKGLVNGTGKGADGKPEYAWDSPVTRAQLVTVLYRFAKLIGKA